MPIILFGLAIFIAIFLNILTAQGYFNVSDHLFWKQTTNILSHNQPNYLTIDKQNIGGSIERVGIDSNGKMAAPSSPNIIAWYQFSALPGQKGNLIVSGHKDSTFGPAVFYTLNQVKPGDPIKIKSEEKEYTYVVTNNQTYSTEDLPVKQIFDDQNQEAIAYLITCDGIFNLFSQKYDQRTLVKAAFITN